MLGFLLAAVTATTNPPVTLHGIGDVRIGMPVSRLSNLGAGRDPGYEDLGNCSYWSIPKREGLAFMVSGGRVVRIDIDSPKFRTLSGAHVGLSESDVRRIYGSALKVEAHPYTGPDGHYLVYRARGEPYGLIFETNGETQKVDSFRVGLWEHVQLIEGCS